MIAHETATTIFLRGLAAQNTELAQSLFHSDRIPSVNQYNPHFRHFEQLEGELLISARSGIPLLRYNTKDLGDVLYFEEAESALHVHNLDLVAEFQRRAAPSLLWRLPIVYLFGRGKFSATINGIMIFPEYIKYILDHTTLVPWLSGRFMLQTEEEQDFSQTLHLRVELSEGIVQSNQIEEQVKQVFVTELPKISSEYRHLLESVKDRAHPRVTAHAYGDPAYFAPGIIKKTA